MSLFLPNFAKIIEQTSKTGRNMKAKLILLTVLATMLLALAMAQNTMRITYKDGTIQNVDITRVDSIIFVDMEPKPQDASITGDWMWGGLREGYYEVISFATGRTFTAEDCYFAYGYTNHTYGTYTYSGIQLNLFSNGIGYKRMNRWFVIHVLPSSAGDHPSESMEGPACMRRGRSMVVRRPDHRRHRGRAARGPPARHHLRAEAQHR